MQFIRVEKKNAKILKDLLSQNNILENDYSSIIEDNSILFPISDEKKALSLSIDNSINATIAFREGSKKKEMNIDSILKEKIGDSYNELRRGFDIVGSIAIMESTEGHEDKISLLAEAIMKVHKNIKSVFVKEGIHDGNYRIQELKHVLGENIRETMHVENGYRIFLEVGTTYFSPRLSQERLRISGMVKENEDILVLFSGVAPYGICLSKHSSARMIYCVELNPKAHEYALVNVKKNKTSNVECILDDGRNAIKDFHKKNMVFDRILLPLPKTADDFLIDVLSISKQNTVIHWYSFCDEEKLEETITKKLKQIFSTKAEYEIINIHKAGQSSPGKIRVCTDVKINRIL